MATKAERKALGFLAAVVVLGAAVRVTRAVTEPPAADAATNSALARQIAAVDSAGQGSEHPRPSGGRGVARTGGSSTPAGRSASGRGKKSGRSGRSAGSAGVDPGSGSVAAGPRAIAPVLTPPGPPPVGAIPLGAEPSRRTVLSPTLGVDERSPTAGAKGTWGRRKGSDDALPSLDPRAPHLSPNTLAKIDVDIASAIQLEQLPRVGPALAQRIVDDRVARGPFGSLDGLRRVRGVGPALADLLRDRVTFSGTPRPHNAVAGPRLTSRGAAPTSARRRSPP
jgi:hypothetical protein